jgi:hypothetical protein
VDATSRKGREASLDGADGAVRSTTELLRDLKPRLRFAQPSPPSKGGDFSSELRLLIARNIIVDVLPLLLVDL